MVTRLPFERTAFNAIKAADAYIKAINAWVADPASKAKRNAVYTTYSTLSLAQWEMENTPPKVKPK